MTEIPAIETLSKKLGIKPGHTVCIINSPEGYMETLGAQVTQTRLIKGIEKDADIIQVFVTLKSDLESSFPHLKKLLGKNHALWVSWPRKISGIPSDLDENIIREIGLKNGLIDVKVCTVDDWWSGIKFVYKLHIK
jgi:hypothetical protein